jgi:hypothetical protein
MSAQRGVGQSASSAVELQKMPETFALLHDTKEWNVGKLRCASDRKDGWADGDQPLW